MFVCLYVCVCVCGDADASVGGVSRVTWGSK